jgi:hypothetical protein
MSHYSETHRDISKENENPDILTVPEDYFGPNYKILLNYWIYLDSLNPGQKSIHFHLCNILYGEKTRRLHDLAEEYCNSFILLGLYCLDCELLIVDRLIESGQPLIFPKLF